LDVDINHCPFSSDLQGYILSVGKRAKVKHVSATTVRLRMEAIEPDGVDKKNVVQKDTLGMYSEV
jgi:hypothetical protein